jgi:hypothetical protein
MPIAGPLLATLIQAQMTANGMTGQYDLQLSQAVGNGIVNAVLASAVYTGVSTGLGLGAGVSTGSLLGTIIIGASVSGLIFSQMSAMGLAGQKSLPFASSIGNAVAAHMATAIVQGASTVVGIGTGTGIIIGIIGPSVGSMITLQMTAMGLTGQYSITLANAIGLGIALAFQTSTVTTAITGVAVGPVPPAFPPIPSVGSDTGKIV